MPPVLCLLRFASDCRGNIAIMTALSSLVLFACIGAAIDYARLSRVKTDLQSALDAATLAAASETGNFDHTAKRYLSFNGEEAPAHLKGVQFIKRPDGTVISSVTAEMKASFLQLAGFGSFAMQVSSAAKAVRNQIGTRLSIKTADGGGVYDKDFYIVVRNGSRTISERLVQAYDYTCVCHSIGAVFSPAKGKAVTVDIKPGESYAFKMVVYRDPYRMGMHWYPEEYWSDSAKAGSHLKVSGECIALGGQTQKWDDGQSSDFASLQVNLTCVPIYSGKPLVALVR